MTMYLDHFGLREAPFKITPHTEFFFAGANRGETLDALIYAITAGEGMVKVAGEVGSGKTMLCRVLMERLPDSVETIYLAVPSLTRDEMIAVIAGDLGIDTTGAGTTKIIRGLQERLIQIHSEGRQVVALIDEAHAMPLETLEEIRLLSNLETNHDKLMQIVLFGQPELDEHLSLPHMRQLKERITHAFTLLPLPARDIKDYLDFRLRAAGYKGPELFGPQAINLIAEASEGLTRRINIYADKTLLAAFAAGTHTVSADHVRAAITDTQITLPRNAVRGNLIATAAAGLAAGLIIGFVVGRQSVPATEATPFQAKAQQSGIILTSPVKAAVSVARPVPQPVTEPASASSPPAHGMPDAREVEASPAPAKTAPAQDWLAAKLETDSDRLKAAAPQRWAIQLMTADQRERAAIENYLNEARRILKSDAIFLYPAGTNETPRIGVVYGDFANRTAAQAELSKLPQRIGQFRPYARSFQAIRDDSRAGSS